jgi:hypothetical protein
LGVKGYAMFMVCYASVKVYGLCNVRVFFSGEFSLIDYVLSFFFLNIYSLIGHFPFKYLIYKRG